MLKGLHMVSRLGLEPRINLILPVEYKRVTVVGAEHLLTWKHLESTLFLTCMSIVRGVEVLQHVSVGTSDTLRRFDDVDDAEVIFDFCQCCPPKWSMWW